jgi:phospholipid transport system substrate-binding protein
VKRRFVQIFAPLLAVLVLAFSSVASAGGATDLVKAKQTALFDLLKVQSAENDKKVAAIFDEMLDYGAVSEGALGTEWAARSDAEKTQFSDVLKQLLRKAVEKNLRKTVNYTIEYVSESADGSAMVVKTLAKSKADAKEEPIEIVYKLAQKNGAWKVIDITTEGVSMVNSWRRQFTAIVKKDGFAALIQKMKDKLAKNDV